jgi:hypothetical protein
VTHSLRHGLLHFKGRGEMRGVGLPPRVHRLCARVYERKHADGHTRSSENNPQIHRRLLSAVVSVLGARLWSRIAQWLLLQIRRRSRYCES